MKLTTLISGGMIWIPENIQGTYASTFLLEEGDKKILLEPGFLPTIRFLEEKFENLGITPDDITDVLISHIHLDHGFNSIFFKKAFIHIPEGYDKKDYSKFGLLNGPAYTLMVNDWKDRAKTFNGGDVLFDKIEVHHTPYHSKEHCSFIIETDNMGKVFFPGDICMNRIEYFDIKRGLRTDKTAEVFLKLSEGCNYILFTHDSPLKV